MVLYAARRGEPFTSAPLLFWKGLLPSSRQQSPRLGPRVKLRSGGSGPHLYSAQRGDRAVDVFVGLVLQTLVGHTASGLSRPSNGFASPHPYIHSISHYARVVKCNFKEILCKYSENSTLLCKYSDNSARAKLSDNSPNFRTI